MSTAFSRAPHIEGSSSPVHPTQAPNAALLIDFDNVTMGMRSDLSKELKTLLQSEVIRGKVTVQRAYADWRRYPQYIVPLSEASIDLIFAPAYGSSKKNATDIRMAIDGMELVFTRPEIGTYILLTGDSDFSSLVLKLKEYGKYVIGVGIQESSSDILVQNCDEYYSYTSLSGLRKTADGTGVSGLDPWVLVEKAVEQMNKRNDVMRSDRLKQVMLELDAGFDEKSYGFSKFSRFLTEAAQKGLLQLKKMENGQYEILPSGKGDPGRSAPAATERRGSRSRKDDGRRRDEGRTEARKSETRKAPAAAATEPDGTDALASAYDLLRRAIRDLLQDQEGDSVRDSDVKRRMLAIESGFDEAELGFGKFSRFLRQAHDHEVVDLRKTENGQYHVALREETGTPGKPADPAPRPQAQREEPRAPAATTAGPDAQRSTDGSEARRLRPRLSARRRGGKDEPPPLLEGQVVGGQTSPVGSSEPSKRTGPDPRETRSEAPRAGDPVLDPQELRLPTGRASVIKYLSNSYRGVGEKTAETLVDALGEDLFRVLQTDPSRISQILPPARAEKVLEGWKEDFARRKARVGSGQGSSG
jgi:uncharacterized protein (TIGR00288 family)